MYNKHTIIGRLGADPEIRFTSDQKAIAKMSVVTTETWKDSQTHERKEKTEWHNVIVYGRNAEVARDFLKKGSLALFEGPSRTRKYQQNGQDRYITEISAELIKLMPRSSNTSDSQTLAASSRTDTAGTYDDFDDDLPEF